MGPKDNRFSATKQAGPKGALTMATAMMVHMCVCAYILACVYTYICVCARVRACARACLCAYVRVCVCVCVCVHDDDADDDDDTDRDKDVDVPLLSAIDRAGHFMASDDGRCTNPDHTSGCSTRASIASRAS